MRGSASSMDVSLVSPLQVGVTFSWLSVGLFNACSCLERINIMSAGCLRGTEDRQHVLSK